MQIRERQAVFREVAGPLVEDVIAPRMAELARQFDNARAVEEPGHPSRLHRQLEFQHTERFPALVKLEVVVSPDREVQQVVVSCNVEILPVLIHFERHQDLSMPLDAVDEERVAAWLNDSLYRFVDTYLQLEHAESYRRENLVTDPVCGMRILPAFAAAQAEYAGQTFYFCIEACQRKFEQDPERFASGAGGSTGQ
jgi:YHS domain-containing protein